MIKLTEMQEKAVYARDCDLLVSAAAGSGKTAVLSERIIQLLMDRENPASINEFLIVTFTNAAASEMKERIGKKIMEAASDTMIDKEVRNHLKKQLSLISSASITTIHSFCLDIIKNNFHLLDIDPAFRVADPSEAEILKMQTAELMLEESYSGKKAHVFSRLCKWLGMGKDEELLNELLRIHRFVCGFPNPAKWLSEAAENYNPENFSVLTENMWVKELMTAGKEQVLYQLERAQETFKLAKEFDIGPYADTLYEDINAIEDYLTGFGDDENPKLPEYPQFGKMKSKPRDADEGVCDYIKEERSTIKKAVCEVADSLDIDEYTIKEQLEKAYPLVKCLEESVMLFHTLFKEKKKKLGVLDFSDFEHMALEILADGENGVANELRERYREIMIDEYQDCNPTQEMIFSYINRKTDGKSTNMFMVGDMKQSIYRFRLADPEIFAGKNKNYKAEGSQVKIVLNNNFRSSATILDGINSVFSKIMSEKTGDVEYGDEEKLYFRSDHPEKEKEHKCELVVLEKATNDMEEDASEPDYIAERILELVSEGYNFRDIAILLRSTKGKSSAIEEALKARNIPYYTDSGSGYFESMEIGLISTLLKVIDNPMQDIELVSLLRSPIFKFDENMLLEIRSAHKGPFYGALRRYAGNGDETAQACSRFLNKLAFWRDMALSMPVDEFVEFLTLDSGIDVFAAALPGGEQRSANLRLFLLQARLLQKSGFKGLFSFVSFLDRLSAGGEGAEAKMLSENSNVVRIITIHKSKGLEFPVVFLSGLGTAFNKRDLSGNILLHKKLQLGIKLPDDKRQIKYPFVSHKAVATRLARENISEEMRVLYVALTRAKERLICTASVKNAAEKIEKYVEKDKISPYEAASAKNFFDWISMGLDENWEVKILKPEDIALSPAKLSEEEKEAEKPVESFAEVAKIFEYKYPYEKSTLLPTKLSVSEIKKRHNYDDAMQMKVYMPQLIEKRSFLENREFTAAEKGIINHLVLSAVDIQEPDVDKTIAELLGKGLMTKEEEEVVERNAISAFFSGEYGERLKKADKVFREMSFGIEVNVSDIFPQQYNDDTIMVQGIIDLLFVEGENAVVLDYKTDVFLDAERREMYKKQLEIYSAAVEKITGCKVVEKCLYMVRTGEYLKL